MAKRGLVKLSAQEIYAHAVYAGFSTSKKVRGRTEAVNATAIALAESGGQVDAHNNRPPDDSYGLWQINMIGAMGPQRRRQFGISDNTELFDPGVNAKAAYRVYTDARSFNPWSVWLSGSYARHLNSAQAAADNPAIDPDQIPDQPDPDNNPWVPDPIENTYDTLQTLIDFVSDGNNWKRVAMFLSGGALLIVGVVFMTRDLLPVGKVVKVARKVVS